MMNSLLRWINEGDELPLIGERVLIAHPRQGGDIWDITTARILARHEDVIALPVKAGDEWPTDYAWSRGSGGFGSIDILLITGNTHWARLDTIALPVGAEHRTGPRGETYAAQVGDVWIPMRSLASRQQVQM